MGTLTRVDGEVALHVTLKNGVLETVELTIDEPPDLTARVGGSCPVA